MYKIYRRRFQEPDNLSNNYFSAVLYYYFYYRALGNLQQALFCFENRLVFAHELTETSAKGSAYGELGDLHRTMGNFEQAATCYGQQLKLARECQDLESESDAECGLGEV
jgi:tetratricopeptide (TPR) repeat protein